MKAYLNAAEVAKLLHVDRATVSRWIKKGVLKGAIRPAGKQQWRIPLSAYEQLHMNSAEPSASAPHETTAAHGRPDTGVLGIETQDYHEL